MNIDIELFDVLYYETRLPIKDVARIMEISQSTLFVNVTKNYGRVLRNTSEAHLVAMEEGRWKYPNDPFEIDWDRFKQLRKDGKTFLEIGKEIGYVQGNKIAEMARKEGYLEDNI